MTPHDKVPSFSDKPTVGAAAFLKNGRVIIVSSVWDGGFNADVRESEVEMAFFNRSEAGVLGPYMPRGWDWDRIRTVEETMDDWAVMYFIPPYEKPHVYKVGDMGLTAKGLNYSVFRVTADGVTVGLWDTGEWVSSIGYYHTNGTLRMAPSGAKHQDPGDLCPPLCTA
jgi:hypothetical protein